MGNFVERLRGLLAKATPGPVFVAEDPANDCPPHKNSGLALIDTGRRSDWPIARLCEWHDARLTAFLRNHAEALADLVEAARAAIEWPIGEEDRLALRAALRKLEESND